MTKKKNQTKRKPLPKLSSFKRAHVLDDALKGKIRSLPGWPSLKVTQWMPIVVDHWKLDFRLKPDNAEY